MNVTFVPEQTVVSGVEIVTDGVESGFTVINIEFDVTTEVETQIAFEVI